MDQRLTNIRHLALDMDGTIYRGGTLFPFTNPFLRLLDQLGISYSFLTNNCSKSLDDYKAHLDSLGVSARREQIYTSAHATFEYLKSEHAGLHRLFLIATPSLTAEVQAAGFQLTADDPQDEPDAVLVAFDMSLTFASLCRAAYWIKQGKPFFATHPDFVCPTDQPTVIVDCGSICAALTAATGVRPIAVPGKPDPRMLLGLASRHSLSPHEMAMVGDRIYTDIEMARRAGALGILVLTGEATQRDVDAASNQPDIVVNDLESLGQLLQS
ncbi:MAG: HAD-IIA family hydrolase [Verrucomicrobiaceae bacterium]|nr:HAD-IIA family hydrolase [Verrucomicrobiaceae bacterium]